MNVLVSGSSGLIGSALAERLVAGGHAAGRLLRPPRQPDAGDALWDPAAGTIDRAGLEGRDAVVHLAGENVGRRWSRKIIARIRDSRVGGTRVVPRKLLDAGFTFRHRDLGPALRHVLR